MSAFLKSMDSKCWKSVLTGRELPSIKDAAGKTTLKPEITWTKEVDEESLGNLRALNALFNGINHNVFKLINTCTSAKEAWNILEVTYEGTSKVKVLRLQILTSRFEALKINDDETIAKFNVWMLDLVNESFAICEKIAKSKMKKKNEIAFQSICEDNSKQSLKAPENENLAKGIALLSRRFTKFKNKFYKKAGGYGSQTNRDGASLNSSVQAQKMWT
ncbi:gag-pol polyprotein [Cucumis melo var. makuwa]|uniref:Gag-pol polyprotein n=1 Tax=Cucumis melo var. makuwa TaxID=1194695 RepID=A0A5D3CDY8_CUCMM|nr:gag-pol polyprotein [Cucumis melo var. makuwa]TYK09428.1 gag-pol polyprotein [Cucumis melo var. makuwa]